MVHVHPGSEAACRCQSELHFVSLAFGRLRQAAIQRKVVYETLSEVLVYLPASLNGTILETMWISSCPVALSVRQLEQRNEEGHPKSLEVWDWLQVRLTRKHELRLAYLLYHCGLDPREILHFYLQE
jgi:hypothetical protein